jgi:hypothetical protein
MEASPITNVPNQNEITVELKRIFGDNNVVPEWNVAKNSRDQYTRELYSPRVDFAVGPFNIDSNIDKNRSLIDASYRKYEGLLQRLKIASDSVNDVFCPNQNPRCFLAIELEAKTSRKHRLGSMFNASAMGKIGIVIASNEQVFRSFVKIRRYFEFLKNAWKSPYAPKNLMILRKDDFLRILREQRMSQKQANAESK